MMNFVPRNIVFCLPPISLPGTYIVIDIFLFSIFMIVYDGDGNPNPQFEMQNPQFLSHQESKSSISVQILIKNPESVNFNVDF